MTEPRNLLARNYERMTIDLTFGGRWRFGVRRRKWRFLTTDPENQRTYVLDIGPLGLHVWRKAAHNGGDT